MNKKENETIIIKDNNTYLKIRIKVTKVKTDTTTFNAYKVLSKDKKWIDLRFTQAVKNAPTLAPNENQREMYIVVHTDNINYTEKYLYPRFWVRAIEEIIPIETPNKDIKSMFDELPF